MKHQTFTTTDSCQISYISTTPPSSDQGTTKSSTTTTTPTILLLHGFSGSSAYFKHNIPILSQHHPVVAWDMRGHGRSSLTPSRGGYHVARLAADLRELIAHLRGDTSARDDGSGQQPKFVAVGCSIGAAVLWTYIELFGCSSADFAGLIFVDQAPLQNRSPRGDWDERFAHTGCYDEATTLAAQQAWAARDRGDAQRGLIEGCLGYFHPDFSGKVPNEEQKREDFEFFDRISSQCTDGEWLGLLIRDHTGYDHREALELIVGVPTLVMMGRYSGCFTLEGLRESVRRINRGNGGREIARESVFECGHWLFYEDAERFNREVLEFVGGL